MKLLLLLGGFLRSQILVKHFSLFFLLAFAEWGKGRFLMRRFAHCFHWGSKLKHWTLRVARIGSSHLNRLPEEDDRIIVQLELPLFADIRAFVRSRFAAPQSGKRRRSSSRLLSFCNTGDRKFLLSANCDFFVVLIVFTLTQALQLIVLFGVLVLVVTLENDLLLDDGFLTGMTLSPQPASV